MAFYYESMRDFYSIFGVFCLIFFVFGCDLKNEEISSFNYEIERVRIEIDSTTSRSSRGMQQIFVTKDKEYYVHGDKSKFSILFFDLEKNKLEFEIPLDRNGPNGIESFNGFFIKSLDSIYVYYGYTYSLWQINLKGEVLKKYQWAYDNKIDGILLNPYGEDAVFYKDLVFLPASPNLSPSNFWRGNVNQIINLKDGTVDFNTRFPEIFKKGNYFYSSMNVSRCLTPDGLFLYSFGPDHNMYLINPNSGERIKALSFPSKLITIQKAGNYLNDFDGDKFNEDAELFPSYKRVLFDEENQVYYRVVKLEKENFFSLSRYSVIIIDRNFKKIGEVLLAEEGLTGKWFMSKKGLCVPVSDFAEGSKENEILFYCFKFNLQ